MAIHKSFQEMGNLAFYDTWQPEYVYFASLAHYANENNVGAGLNAPEVAKRAKKAQEDAMAHINLNGMTDQDSEKEFLDKFRTILNFLKQARNYELQNERRYFNQKLKMIYKTFSAEEQKKINELRELQIELKNGKKVFDYKNFITLINALMSGMENAKLLAAHESKRINEISNIIDDLLQSRANQVQKGLIASGKLVSKRFSTEEIVENAKKHLQTKIQVEYVKTKQLDRKSKSGYALFGGSKFSKVEGTCARVLSNWAENIVHEIMNKPEIIQKMVSQIQPQYPINDGNFKHLEAEIRQTIILGIIQYGLNNLNTVLNKELNDAVIAEIETELTTNNTIFDTVSRYDIHGLNGDFGQDISETAMLKDSKTIADISEKNATELYERIKTLIGYEKKLKDKSQPSYLIQAMTKSKDTNNVSDLDKAKEIMTLIDSITKLNEQTQEIIHEWEQTQVQNAEQQLTFSVENSTIPITISIVDGVVTADMEKLVKAIQKTKGYTELGFGKFNPTTLKSTLITLKRRASLELKKKLIAATTNAVNQHLFSLSETELVSMMGKELERLSVHINGPTLAELIPGINFRATSRGNIMIDWMGNRKGKNDMMVIEVKYDQVVGHIKSKLTSQIKDKVARQTVARAQEVVQKAQEDFLFAFSQECDEQIQNVNTGKNKSNPQRYSKMLDDFMLNTHRLGKTKEELAKAQTKVAAAWRKLRDALLDAGINENQIDDADVRHRILHTLENSFQISTTVKSYDNYMDTVGFGGGSLGGDLDSQIDHLNDIFTTAGMPIDPDDINWLKSAIINCFPGSIVKEKNKGLIENYLGAVAAFALFDEGGVESAIISDFYKTYFEHMQNSVHNADILHLYVVNGIYVPGSEVIDRTIKTLEKEVLPQIANIPVTMNRGAGLTIINRANDSMIVNRPMASYLENPDEQAWYTTGAEVKKHVELKILFLAGLLDIVNSINEKLAETPIPA